MKKIIVFNIIAAFCLSEDSFGLGNTPLPQNSINSNLAGNANQMPLVHSGMFRPIVENQGGENSVPVQLTQKTQCAVPVIAQSMPSVIGDISQSNVNMANCNIVPGTISHQTIPIVSGNVAIPMTIEKPVCCPVGTLTFPLTKTQPNARAVRGRPARGRPPQGNAGIPMQSIVPAVGLSSFLITQCCANTNSQEESWIIHQMGYPLPENTFAVDLRPLSIENAKKVLNDLRNAHITTLVVGWHQWDPALFCEVLGFLRVNCYLKNLGIDDVNGLIREEECKSLCLALKDVLMRNPRFGLMWRLTGMHVTVQRVVVDRVKRIGQLSGLRQGVERENQEIDKRLWEYRAPDPIERTEFVVPLFQKKTINLRRIAGYDAQITDQLDAINDVLERSKSKIFSQTMERGVGCGGPVNISLARWGNALVPVYKDRIAHLGWQITLEKERIKELSKIKNSLWVNVGAIQQRINELSVGVQPQMQFLNGQLGEAGEVSNIENNNANGAQQ